MFIEYYSKNLNEYQKIISTLDSCETWDAFLYIEKMSLSFVKHCENRDIKLKNRWLKQIWNYRRYRGWKMFTKAATIQCETAAHKIKTWADGYQMALEEAKTLIQKEEEESKKRKIISGFVPLFKKKKKCKRKL